MADIRALIHSLRAILRDPSKDIHAQTHLGLERLDTWLAAGGELPYQAQEDARFQGKMVYEDEDLGFIIVSMAWGVGAKTPIHDHGTWGLMGVIDGTIEFTNYAKVEGSEAVQEVACFKGQPGDVTRVIPPDMEIHRIANAGETMARSIHIYGRNIGF